MRTVKPSGAILTKSLWALFLLGHWLACGLLAWHLLAKVDFLYPAAYSVLNIDEHIERYGPQNRYRDHFAGTSEAQHFQLFAEINRAIHTDPDALAAIEFTPAAGPTQTLLRPPEVLHLTDVAHLVDGVYWLGLAATLWAALALVVLLYRRASLPRPARVAGAVLSALILITLAVFLIGPKDVFYYLHTWAFPPEHPWFFYYQDSLMTTLMKAPDLFGFIAVVLVVLWHLLWGLSLLALARLWPTHRPSQEH